MRLQAAFEMARREDFLTEDQRRYAGDDRALPIGHGQTNSQPSTVRRMLELLDVHEGETILDVGAGSGWTTVLLGLLTGPGGRVYGVELVPELVEWGRRNIEAYDMPWATVRQAERGVLGYPEAAPFDKILVSAEARALPDSLLEQLRDGGRMVIPVFGRMLRVDKDAGGQVHVHKTGHYAFVPLR
jgi:protein-L-isoaspartate(D-aspartate) O-methyltransferase